MADPHSTPLTTAGDGPTTTPAIEEAFVADRQTFWAGFVRFTTYTVVAVVLLLILMRIFLV